MMAYSSSRDIDPLILTLELDGVENSYDVNIFNARSNSILYMRERN